jgi:hypothetical protein
VTAGTFTVTLTFSGRFAMLYPHSYPRGERGFFEEIADHIADEFRSYLVSGLVEQEAIRIEVRTTPRYLTGAIP